MNKGDKKKNSQLETWANTDRAAASAATTAAAAPNPLLQRQQQEDLHFMDWEDGTGDFAGKPRDVRDAPGLGTALALYDDAASNRDDGQQGTGLIQMGVGGSNPELAAKLDAQRKARAQERAAGGLERQLAIRRAEVHGDVLPIAQTDINQRTGLASILNGRAANSQGLYAQFRPQPGFFGQLGSAFANSLGTSLGRLGYNSQTGFSMGFAQGGNLSDALRLPGDVATVGEEGPEVARKRADGSIEIIPLSRRAQNPGDGASVAAPPSVPTPPLLTRVISRVLGQDTPTIETRPNADGIFEPLTREPAAQPQLSRRVFSEGAPPSPTEFTPSPVLTRAHLLDMGLKEVPEFGGAELSPVPQAALDARERLTRPQMRSTGDERADLVDYENRLERWRDPADSNGRAVSGLKMAGRGFERGGVVGAVAGFVHGLVSPNSDERLSRDEEIARTEGRIGRLDAHAKEAAEQRLLNERADYYEQRPGLERDRQAWLVAQRQQLALQREIGNRLKEPRPFDANDPYDSDLAARAQSAGVFFDPHSFGDFKNPATMEVIDPSDPSGTKKTRLVFDRANNTWGPPATADGSGVTTGYAVPVHPDTQMTSKQESDVAARDRAFEATERQRAVSNDLRRQGLLFQGKRLDLSQAQFDNRLSEQTRRELKSANDLAAQAERYQQAANDIGSRTQYTDPQTNEVKESRKADNQRDLYAGRAAALRQQIVSDYGYLFDSDGTGPKMSADQFRQMFPSLGGNYTGEASRLGVQITDPGSMQGPVRRSPMPRRGAPAATPSQPPQSHGRVSRANFGRVRAQNPQLRDKSDAEIEGILRSQGIDVY